MNIKQCGDERTYNVPYFSFKVVASDLEYMLTDKLSVAATQRICRRVKDMYDIYAIAHLQNFSLKGIVQNWYDNQVAELDCNSGIFLFDVKKIVDIKYAYESFRGIINKPPFDDMYRVVVEFAAPIYEAILYNVTDKFWDSSELRWK